VIPTASRSTGASPGHGEGHADAHGDAPDEQAGGARPSSWLHDHPYATLGLALTTSLVVMFALTFVGVYRFDDVFVNLNRFYMALIMVAPMAVIMLAFMGHMFRNRWANAAIVGAAVVVGLGTFWAIQRQALVGDEQMIRSMIPHHSIAIKTCEYADLSDAELAELCQEIISAQEREISQMRDILDRLGR
jgi:hypothetical protein